MGLEEHQTQPRRGSGVSGPDQFKALAIAALRRLQRMPHIVRGFFADPNLAYITNTA